MKHVRNGFHSTLIMLGALIIAGVASPVASVAAGAAGSRISASPNNDWPTH